MSYTRQDWRKFHYGTDQQKQKIEDWTLISKSGNTYAEGSYQYCAMIRRQMETANPQMLHPSYKLSIIPTHKLKKLAK